MSNKNTKKTKTTGLETVRDFLRYAVSQFNKAGLTYGHGTNTAFEEAAFLVLEGLHLPVDSLDPWLDARLSQDERTRIAGLIEARVKTRKPLPYLLNKAYLQGIPFYVDERVIVPRSFIAEILCADDGFALMDDVQTVLDLCTGSGCLAVVAAHVFENAQVDAVELSPKAYQVARKNIDESGVGDRISLFKGDLFTPLKNKKYDLIITNPPYVDPRGMKVLPDEYRFEPKMALAGGGNDGMDIVRRIIDESPAYLTKNGALLCEIGRGRDAIEVCYPQLPFLWLETENSEGEVFFITRQQLIC